MVNQQMTTRKDSVEAIDRIRNPRLWIGLAVSLVYLYAWGQFAVGPSGSILRVVVFFFWVCLGAPWIAGIFACFNYVMTGKIQ